MSSLFLMSTITDRRTADAFLQLYEAHGVNVTLRTVGIGTAVQETLSTLGLEQTEKAVLFAMITAETWPGLQKDRKSCAAGGGHSPDLAGGAAGPAPQNAHRRAGHRHCIHRAAEQHRRKTGPWVPHGAPDPDLEGGEYLEGYPL